MLEGPVIEKDTSEVNTCKDFFVCVFLKQTYNNILKWVV